MLANVILEILYLKFEVDPDTDFKAHLPLTSIWPLNRLLKSCTYLAHHLHNSADP